MLTVKDLSVRYGEKVAISDASFSLDNGEIFGIAGPNGGGKSSLIQAILGLVQASQGNVEYQGVSNASPRAFRRACRHIAYVPQKQAVATGFPIQVREVAGMGIAPRFGWFRQLSAVQRRRLDTALEALELTRVADRGFAQVSGGQQQKALVARALVQSAPLIVLDEPFRGVDAQSQDAICAALKDHREAGGSAIIVHHGDALMLEICDRIAFVEGRIRDIKVVESGGRAVPLSMPQLVPATAKPHADNDHFRKAG